MAERKLKEGYHNVNGALGNMFFSIRNNTSFKTSENVVFSV